MDCKQSLSLIIIEMSDKIAWIMNSDRINSDSNIIHCVCHLKHQLPPVNQNHTSVQLVL